MGHTILSTPSPQEALRLVSHEKFDFVLTDIKMPDMDGITLAQHVLEIDPEVGILFMTGYADVETAKKAIATGAYDYIMKPFELAEIRKSVATAFAKRRDLQKKQGAGGLQHLSNLMGALYTAGDSEALIKLVLRFALFHFGLKEGMVVFYNKAAELVQVVLGTAGQDTHLIKVEPAPAAEFPEDFFAAGESEFTGKINQHPALRRLLGLPAFSGLAESLSDSAGSYCFFSLPATDKLKLVLVIKSDQPVSVTEADRQMLTVLLSLSSISLDNIVLLQEAQSAMVRLEDFKDHLVSIERAATQGMMSSEIAHELNNFIAIVLSNIELFEMKAAGAYPETAVKYLENVKKNIGKFEKFTASLSAAGKLDTKRQSFDLNELINEIATFARHQRRFRKIRLELVLDNALPQVFLDMSQMQQVLYNMINNAADAIEAERVDGVIRISTQFDAEKHAFKLVVQDNGCGFSPENLQRAFRDRFTTKEHGHGFGLTVCRKVVKNHEGAIEVESSPGNGATITIAIPLADPQTAQTAPATIEAPAAS